MSYENYGLNYDHTTTNGDVETVPEWILNLETHSELTKHIKFLVKKSKLTSKQNSCEISFLIVLLLALTGNLVLSGLFYFSRDSEGRVKIETISYPRPIFRATPV